MLLTTKMIYSRWYDPLLSKFAMLRKSSIASLYEHIPSVLVGCSIDKMHLARVPCTIKFASSSPFSLSCMFRWDSMIWTMICLLSHDFQHLLGIKDLERTTCTSDVTDVSSQTIGMIDRERGRHFQWIQVPIVNIHFCKMVKTARAKSERWGKEKKKTWRREWDSNSRGQSPLD